MSVFSYKAKDVSGKEIKDTVEAENLKSAAAKLQSAGYYPVSIEPYKGKKALENRFKRVSQRSISMFTRRLADSLKGGLPIARALGVIERQTEDAELAKITKDIRQQVQDGRSLSETLAKHPKIFSEMYIGMVHAGESAGLLDSVLLRLADFSEKEEELRYRINAALAYPMVMLLVGCVSVLFLLTFVIPRFELMFQDLGQMIPLPTRILIFLSHTVKTGWWIYIPLTIIVILLMRKFSRTVKGRLLISSLKLKIPLLGGFIKKDLVSRFIHMLSVLLSNGVPVLDALSLAKNSIGNHVFAAEIERIYQSVKDGRGLVEPMNSSKLFPPVVSEMVAIGEETGNLESSLTKVAQAYDREVEYAIKTMTSLLEPIIILIAGVVVCFIALSMLLPVFQMSMGIR